VSNVTAINEALTVPCIHCGVTISTREDFCPACGYAQPVKQSFIAAFPA
jgi:ribosomal protein L37E